MTGDFEVVSVGRIGRIRTEGTFRTLEGAQEFAQTLLQGQGEFVIRIRNDNAEDWLPIWSH